MAVYDITDENTLGQLVDYQRNIISVVYLAEKKVPLILIFN